MNKHGKLVELTKKWKKEAEEAPMRIGTLSVADADRAKAKEECISDVMEVINDHKGD